MELRNTHTALLLIACYMAKRTGGVSPLAYNVFGLGEVAFVRWLVCRKAILPNPCYAFGR